MLAVRWYLRYGLSDRDVEDLLAERGVTVWGSRSRPESCDLQRLAALHDRHRVATAALPDLQPATELADTLADSFRAGIRHDPGGGAAADLPDDLPTSGLDSTAHPVRLHEGDRDPRPAPPTRHTPATRSSTADELDRPSPDRHPDPIATTPDVSDCSSRPTRSCAGTDGSSPATGPPNPPALADQPLPPACAPSPSG